MKKPNVNIFVGFLHQVFLTGYLLYGFRIGLQLIELFGALLVLGFVFFDFLFELIDFTLVFETAVQAVFIEKSDDGCKYTDGDERSEEYTSELQSRQYL